MSYGDNPISDLRLDWLDRNKAVDALRDVLTEPELDTPLVVGVYGGWGTGKTSVMGLLKASLPGEALALWFDAWKYARQDVALWRALLLAVVDALGDERAGLARFMAGEEERKALRRELDELATSLYRSQTITERGDLRVNWGAAVPFGVDLALRIATLGLSDKLNLPEVVGKLTGEDAEKAMKVVEREEARRYREQVTSLEQFQAQLRGLVERHVVGAGRRLYLFVDDLDRCLPEDAVGALEAIKLFLDLPGCVFVLGMDRNVVEQGIRVRYREFALAAEGAGRVPPVDPRQYLDKMIQVPFNLPPLSNGQMEDFVGRWCDEHGEAELKEFAPLIAAGVAPNPRSVKRTLNVLRLMLRLEWVREHRADSPETGLAALGVTASRQRLLPKLVVLQTSYEDLYRNVVDAPELLRELEGEARGRHRPQGTTGKLDGYARLKRMLGMAPYFEGLNREQLAELVYVSEVAA